MKFIQYVFALTVLAFLATGSLQAQDAAAPVDLVDIKMVDKTPSFPGGKEAMVQYVGSQLAYPAECRKNKTEATIPVEFIILADGSVTGAKNIGDTEVDNRLIREAIRVVNAMPKWEAAVYKDKKVACKMVLPIAFKLQ